MLNYIGMNSLVAIKEWIELQDKELISPDLEIYKEFGDFFTYLFNNNQDGICLLDPTLRIISVNSTMIHWYGYKAPFNGKKCYEVYHGRKTACEKCPTLKTLKNKTTSTLCVPYETKYTQNGNQRLTTFPVFNKKKEVVAVIEHIRDISTEEKEKEALAKLNTMLDQQSQKLMEQNIALRVLGTQIKDDSHTVINEISLKIDSIIVPLIEEMKEKVEPGLADTLSLLEANIYKLIDPFLCELPLEKMNLSKREIQLADLIRSGFTSKEISSKLCISKKTVDFHRTNLRKKLKVKNGQSLQSHLLSIGKAT